MITLTRDGTKVVLRFDTTVQVDRPAILFTWNAGTELFAALLTRQVASDLSDAMVAARREAYNQGWADAKSKRAKQGWFPGVL